VSPLLCAVVYLETLKMLEWKTWNQIVGVENAVPENAGPNRVGGKHRTGKRGPNFTGVEKAGPPSMEQTWNWVTGSMGHLGHLSRLGHRVIILTQCETQVFPVFEKIPR